MGAIFNGKSIKKINKDAIVLVDDTIEKKLITLYQMIHCVP